MRKQKKLVSVSTISMALIAATVFLPGLVQSFYFPPAPEYQINTIIHEVEGLVTKGALSQGQGSELNAIIGEAQKVILDKENTTTACNLLQDFINQVQAYINAGSLATTEGEVLIGSAHDVISQLR